MKSAIRREDLTIQGSNWFKDPALLRAYTAQRDHFLQLHGQPAPQRLAPSGRPGDPARPGRIAEAAPGRRTAASQEAAESARDR